MFRTVIIPAHTVIFTAAVSRSGNTTSGHCPVWVCEYYSVLLSPLGEHFLLRDEPVSSMGGVLMDKILVALILSLFIVMIGDFPIPFCPGRETRQERED